MPIHPNGSHDPSPDVARLLERLVLAVETRIAPSLERLAAALEQQPLPIAEELEPGAALSPILEFRRLLADAQWLDAARLLDAIDADPGRLNDAEAKSLRDELDSGRGQAVLDLRARIDASQRVNDPDAVLGFHEQLVPLLDHESRESLERDIVRWLMGLVQRRMRTGTVRADVATLAAQVAGRFAHTIEGASLRASLGVLRRSAGLCPRCAQPYAGLEAACPKCRGVAAIRGIDFAQDDDDEDELSEADPAAEEDPATPVRPDPAA
jgi:hypothetical protein